MESHFPALTTSAKPVRVLSQHFADADGANPARMVGSDAQIYGDEISPQSRAKRAGTGNRVTNFFRNLIK